MEGGGELPLPNRWDGRDVPDLTEFVVASLDLRRARFVTRNTKSAGAILTSGRCPVGRAPDVSRKSRLDADALS